MCSVGPPNCHMTKKHRIKFSDVITVNNIVIIEYLVSTLEVHMIKVTRKLRPFLLFCYQFVCVYKQSY